MDVLMSHSDVNIVYYNTLCKAANLFIEKGCDNIPLNELVSILQPLSEEISLQWYDTRDVLKDIFRFAWAKIVSRAEKILQSESDPRDALSSVFSEMFRLFLVEEPILGKCIILESHRYDKGDLQLKDLSYKKSYSMNLKIKSVNIS